MEWLKELPGALATVCIVLSFCFSDVKLIRWFNLIGSLFFVTYTLFVPSLFTGVANGIINELNYPEFKHCYILPQLHTLIWGNKQGV